MASAAAAASAVVEHVRAWGALPDRKRVSTRFLKLPTLRRLVTACAKVVVDAPDARVALQLASDLAELDVPEAGRAAVGEAVATLLRAWCVTPPLGTPLALRVTWRNASWRDAAVQLCALLAALGHYDTVLIDIARTRGLPHAVREAALSAVCDIVAYGPPATKLAVRRTAAGSLAAVLDTAPSYALQALAVEILYRVAPADPMRRRDWLAPEIGDSHAALVDLVAELLPNEFDARVRSWLNAHNAQRTALRDDLADYPAWAQHAGIVLQVVDGASWTSPDKGWIDVAPDALVTAIVHSATDDEDENEEEDTVSLPFRNILSVEFLEDPSDMPKLIIHCSKVKQPDDKIQDAIVTFSLLPRDKDPRSRPLLEASLRKHAPQAFQITSGAPSPLAESTPRVLAPSYRAVAQSPLAVHPHAAAAVASSSPATAGAGSVISSAITATTTTTTERVPGHMHIHMEQRIAQQQRVGRNTLSGIGEPSMPGRIEDVSDVPEAHGEAVVPQVMEPSPEPPIFDVVDTGLATASPIAPSTKPPSSGQITEPMPGQAPVHDSETVPDSFPEPLLAVDGEDSALSSVATTPKQRRSPSEQLETEEEAHDTMSPTPRHMKRKAAPLTILSGEELAVQQPSPRKRVRHIPPETPEAPAPRRAQQPPKQEQHIIHRTPTAVPAPGPAGRKRTSGGPRTAPAQEDRRIMADLIDFSRIAPVSAPRSPSQPPSPIMADLPSPPPHAEPVRPVSPPHSPPAMTAKTGTAAAPTKPQLAAWAADLHEQLDRLSKQHALGASPLKTPFRVPAPRPRTAAVTPTMSHFATAATTAASPTWNIPRIQARTIFPYPTTPLTTMPRFGMTSATYFGQTTPVTPGYYAARMGASMPPRAAQLGDISDIVAAYPWRELELTGSELAHVIAHNTVGSVHGVAQRVAAACGEMEAVAEQRASDALRRLAESVRGAMDRAAAPAPGPTVSLDVDALIAQIRANLRIIEGK